MNVIPFAEHLQAAVVDVVLSIQIAEFGVPITLDEQPDLRNISGYCRQNNGNFWVAMDGEEVVGTIALFDIGNGQAALKKMFVKAAYRGSGVAAQLLSELLRWSSQRGVREIFLGTTEVFLAAHRFYKKNGFEEVERTSLPEAFPRVAVDTKFYRHSIRLGR